jgi:hypothetical protein
MTDDPQPLSGDGMHTRRQLLKIGGTIGLVGTLGFGYLYWDSEESTTAATSLPDVPPAGMEFVATGHAGALLSEEAVHTAFDDELDAQAVGNPADLESLLDRIEQTTGIDPRAVGEVSGFGSMAGPDGNRGGFLVESNTDPETVRSSLAAADLLLEESEYDGYDLYIVGNDEFAGEIGLCDLGGGEFAVGTRHEIEGVIDVREGVESSASGAIDEAVGSAPAGPLQFGFLLPEDLFERLGLGSAGSRIVDLGKLEYGYGSLNGGVLSVTIRAASSSAAEDLGSQLNAITTLLGAGGGENIGTLPSAIREQLLDVLGAVEVERNGRLVQLRVPDGHRLVAILAVYLLSQSDF